MSNSISYQLGKWFGGLSNWWRIAIAASIFVLFYISCSSNDEPVAIYDKKICQNTIQEKKQEYADLTSKKQHWAAANIVRSCAYQLESEELKKMVKDAEIASHLNEINNTQSPPLTRAKAMQQLAIDYPEVGEKYAAQSEKIFAELDKKEREIEKKEREIEKKRKKSEGVSVGMSKEDVLASSWGKPQSINTTTTADGTREQWVYGGRSYLYFKNNKLTTIQN